VASQEMEVIGGIRRHDYLHVSSSKDLTLIIVFSVFWDELILVAEEKVPLCSR